MTTTTKSTNGDPIFTSPFPSTAKSGNYIKTEPDASGIVFRATLVRDNPVTPPYEVDNGFWPSNVPDAAGYIGDGKTFVDLADAYYRAEDLMDAYKAGEWGYVGIVVSSRLDGHGVSFWGIKCNYPGTDNSYLLEVANDLLPEARRFNNAILEAAARPHMSDHCETCNKAGNYAIVGRSAYLPFPGMTCDVCEALQASCSPPASMTVT